MRPTEDQNRPSPGRTGGSAPEFSGRSILLGVVDALFRNLPWILALWVVATLGAVAYWMRAPRDYESEMTFLVRNNRPEVVVNPDGSSYMQQRQADVSDAQMSTEVQLFLSRELAEKLLPATGYYGTTEGEREAALARFQKDFQVAPVVKSNMIRVRYSNRDPKRVTQVLDEAAADYLQEHLQMHGNAGSLQFFEQQSAEAEKRWKDAQQNLMNFVKAAGVVSGVEQKDLLLRRQIELQTALHQAEADQKDTSHRIDSIRSRLQTMAARVDTQSRQVPNQYSAERLSTMLAELQNRRTELLAKFRPTERIVTQLDQQIADTTKAFQDAIARVSTEQASDINPLRQTLETELGHAEGTEAGLRGRIQSMHSQDLEYRSQLIQLDQQLPQQQQLQRDVKVTEDNYLLYAKRREEARIGQRMDEQKIANVVLSEKARMPASPRSRTGTVTTLYALALGLGLLAVAMLARFRRTVQTPWDLEGVANVPVLGTVPRHDVPELPVRMRGFN